jgi:hypothetical protein
MKSDPIVTEVRQTRHQISAKFGHNTGRIGEHYKRLDRELRKSGGFQFVTGFFASDLGPPLSEKKSGKIALAPANLRVRQKLKPTPSKRLAAKRP